ncbi:MAG: CBS domain-containing protein [Labedaea sp.]
MRAREIMTSPVITVRPETSVRAAAAILAERGFTALPVVDEDDQLVGIVTEADLVRDRFLRDPRFLIYDRHPPEVVETELVGDVMTSPVTAMDDDCDVADLTTALLKANLRSMPIVDGGRLIGIVTRRDLVRIVGRADIAIAADVRHHLEVYGGPNRWTVQVRDGVVTITDRFDDETDRHVAVTLAEAVPGVARVLIEASHD